MKNRNKEIKVTVKEIVLCNEEERSFCDIFVYEPENIEEQSLGNLYIMGEVLNLSENSSYIINLLASIIKKEFYAKTKRTTMESLEAGLQRANTVLSEFAEQGNLAWVGNLNIACGAYRGGELYFSQAGKAKTLLLRNGQITDIGKSAMKEGSTHPLRTFANIVSGDLENNDMVLFSTPELFNIFSLEKIKRLSSSLKIEDFSSTLQDVIEKEKNIDTVGVLLMKIEEQTDEMPHFHLHSPIASSSTAKEAEKEKVATKKETENENVDVEKYQKGISLEDIIDGYEKMENAAEIEPENYFPAVRSDQKNDDMKMLQETLREVQKEPRSIDELINERLKPGNEPRVKTGKKIMNFFKISSEFFVNLSGAAKRTLSETASFLKKIASKKRSEATTGSRQQQRIEIEIPKKSKFYPLRKKILLAAVILVVLVLAGSLLLTDYKNKNNERQKNYSAMLTEAKEKSDRAEEMQIVKDYAQARILLSEARSIAIKMKNDYKDRDKNSSELLNKIQGQIDAVDFINRIDNPQTAIDLNENGLKNPRQIIKTDNKYYIIDSGNDFYELDLADKKATAVQIKSDSRENLRFSSPMPKTENIVALTDSNKIKIFDSTKKELTGMSIKFSENANIKDMATYNGNLYVLDSGSGQIYKYQIAGNSSGDGKPWLTDPKASQGTSLAIDGEIYILNSDGTANKYLTGNKKDFTLEKLTDPISDSGKIYAKAEFKFLYILDPVNRRILQFDKNKGKIMNQYTSENFDNLNGVAIDDKEEKIYILNGSKIFAIDIRK